MASDLRRLRTSHNTRRYAQYIEIAPPALPYCLPKLKDFPAELGGSGIAVADE